MTLVDFLGILNSISSACVTTKYNETVLQNFEIETVLELSATGAMVQSIIVKRKAKRLYDDCKS